MQSKYIKRHEQEIQFITVMYSNSYMYSHLSDLQNIFQVAFEYDLYVELKICDFCYNFFLSFVDKRLEICTALLEGPYLAWTAG